MSRAFLFGKLPAHGDFVHRGLDDVARGAWDARASDVMQTARTRLGEGFEDAHDQAPPWRFVCGPSELGDDWRAGALAPSVDGSGRRFLIVMGLAGLSQTQAGSAGKRTAEACEGAIYSVFAEGLDADAALSRVQAIADEASSDAGDGDAASLWWTVDEQGRTADRIASAELPADLLVRTFNVETAAENAR